ncbi:MULTISPECIES: hypothetical protein [Methylobacterium]|jgi:hypothetical protein|uniref:Lipoprotein n=1 Tax=Methylobacterium bullatum TaxID=570505 RepID=A0A679JSE2_9HYPH|nr:MULTISPECIES: hypothetical protein [Methylobacterium]KQO51646.1 hypothetical protein ASF08_02600 [Methylobacterium sp. Leaf85]KQP53358.1 hypothetical protein ASF34_03140 [Methylobacterium sp. Leaf106]MBD8903850.1 hypothetical protein [Methylobacterium bullatum]TXN26810.1 hypothetical protein FV220_13660 [Methylobacterium sp. WL19]CAA2143301.1 hypothetical protein MBLL_02751 [Methylobacterium bullatum]
MRIPSNVCAVALIAAALGGCQALSGNSGVMPESEVGPPPSMRGSVPGAQRPRAAEVDPDGVPLQTAPTRRLDLPKSAGGQARSQAESERRIRREDIEGDTTSRSSSGGLAPQMGSGGSVGLGGKF